MEAAANGYVDRSIEHPFALSEHQLLQNSITHQQCLSQLSLNQMSQLNQLNQLSYIDDYQAQSASNPPYYADLKISEDLQRLQVDGQPEQLKHWGKSTYECMEIQLFEFNIAGGSDYGQLFYFVDSGDVLLELDSHKISGYTRNDVLNLIRKQQYHFIRAVSSSSSFGLPIDLKEYLSRRFVRASIDHELQSTIRDNIYIRTVPCTTRLPKPNEVDGLDYKFVTKEEFLEMDRSGLLLESGVFCNHYYGTPLPLSNPIGSHSKLLGESVEMSLNGKSIETGNSMNSRAELLSPAEQPSGHKGSQQSNTQNSNPLQQDSAQLSAMALKRRRNRSNIAAIDANALPMGWEMIDHDHVHGAVYYIDHINKRTQYERPYEVELTKGKTGFGFTLSYLDSGFVVVKTIIPDGPASVSGIIQPGDHLVSVSNVSVSGLNHSDIAKLFSTFETDDRVKLTFARGLHPPGELINSGNISADNGDVGQLVDEFELITVDICKGVNGFGFTISDATNGQKVKKILDLKRCGALRQGDLLASVNGIDLSDLNHLEVVEVLKNHCQVGEETRFTVRRFMRQQNGKQSKEELEVSQSRSAADDLVPKCYEGSDYSPQETMPLTNKLNDNLIAELKANLALNSVNSNGELIASPSTTNLLINGYSNADAVDPNGHEYSVLEANSAGGGFLNSTMILEQSGGQFPPVASEDEFEYFRVFLTRSPTNFSFGFRIVGGSEENRLITIGSIVIGGVAHVDGILKAGDEIISINDQNVMNASHYNVVKLMSECGNTVSLLVRRRKDSDAFDVVLNRDPNDTFGFGFVIISCGNCALIGRIIENSPAQRCGRLKVRDKIIAVNNINITQMNHPDIVNMIKDSGLSLKLRIIPADCYTVELIRSSTKNFGFSIRGGSEFNMALFILRVAPDGPAYSLLNIGDEIIEINSISTAGMTHAEAVLLISQSGASVKLKLRRRELLNPSISNFRERE